MQIFVSSLKNTIFGFVFFLCFFRISFISSFAFAAIPIGLLGLLYMLASRYNLYRLSGRMLTLTVVLMFGYCLALDSSYQGWGIDIQNLFTTRVIAFFVMSVFPAFFVYKIYIKGDQDRLIAVISVALWIQAFCWALAFLSPSIKVFFYDLMGVSDSVNLREHNLETRGFGLSREINFASPFMMVILSIILVQKTSLSIVTTATQLINSNTSAVAILIALGLSRMKLAYKVLVSCIVFGVITFFGEEVFRRLFREFSYSGSRTVEQLLLNHTTILNQGALEHVFGTGEYIFQGGGIYNSDVGWVIMYNYGGGMFIALFSVFIVLLCLRTFNDIKMVFAWLACALVLNSKGLLFGPTAFYFVTCLLLFMRSHEFNIYRKSDYGSH